jgi:hypothetical protein
MAAVNSAEALPRGRGPLSWTLQDMRSNALAQMQNNERFMLFCIIVSVKIGINQHTLNIVDNIFNGEFIFRVPLLLNLL